MRRTRSAVPSSRACSSRLSASIALAASRAAIPVAVPGRPGEVASERAAGTSCRGLVVYAPHRLVAGAVPAWTRWHIAHGTRGPGVAPAKKHGVAEEPARAALMTWLSPRV